MVRRKNVKIAYLLIGLLILIGIIFFFSQEGLVEQTLFAPGFTVTSISPNIQIFNGAPTPDSRFLINMILDGGAQRIVGEIAPSGFQQETNYLTNSPLRFDIDAIDETLDYRIINDNTPLYNYREVVLYDPIIGSAPPCPSGTIHQIDFAGTDRHCIVRGQSGIKGSLTNPTVKNQARFTLSVLGNAITRTVSNLDTTARFVDSSGRERASLIFTGSLITGDPVPNGNNRVPIYTTLSGWNLALPSDFTNYQSLKSSTESVLTTYDQEFDFQTSSCPSGTFDTCISSIFNNLIRNVNNAQSTLISSRYTLEGISVSTVINKNDLTNSIIRIDSDRKIGNPNIVMTLDATWVGIVVLQGKPDILSLSCPIFNSGDRGYIEAVVKNNAETDSNFEYIVSNCDPFQPSFSAFTSTQRFGPSETKTTRIDLNPSTAVGVTRTCTVIVKDKGSTNQDSMTVSCEVKTPLLCTPGNQEVFGKCVHTCKTDGSSYEESFCCEGTPQAISGTFPTKYECVGEKVCINGASNYPICNEGCKEGFKYDETEKKCITGEYCQNKVEFLGTTIAPDFGTRPRAGLEKVIGYITGDNTVACTSTAEYIKFVFAWIVFIISWILGFLLLRDLFNKSKLFGKKTQGLNILVSLLLALLIAGLLYILVYKVLFLAMVIFIIIIIIKIVLKSIKPI